MVLARGKQWLFLLLVLQGPCQLPSPSEALPAAGKTCVTLLMPDTLLHVLLLLLLVPAGATVG
jgi:hypothetical protein